MKKRPIFSRVRNVVYGSALAAAVLSAVTLTAVSLSSAALPDTFRFSADGDFSLSDSAPWLCVRPQEKVLEAAAGEEPTTYEVSLLGVVPVKTVTARAEERRTVTVSGKCFGIRLFSDGVMVVGLTELTSPEGSRSPAYEAGLRKGDIITRIDGTAVRSNSQFTALLQQAAGESVTVTFLRSGKTYTAVLKPVKADGVRKAGLWVRDSLAGLGTLTFADENGLFAGLGHGITDADSGEIYPLFSGSAVLATVTSVKKGTAGEPGELKGSFTSVPVGNLFANTEAGVFGYTASAASLSGCGEKEIAFRQEVRTGKATVYCDVGEGVTAYGVEIEKIRLQGRTPTRNMVIHVTDARLLEKTGGIVQGMSGSPILQNGRLVGAVTHVFVGDPTRGYGIFAENMAEQAEEQLRAA